jgi:hypothetical protein
MAWLQANIAAQILRNIRITRGDLRLVERPRHPALKPPQQGYWSK